MKNENHTMKTAEDVTGRWLVKWTGPTVGARGTDEIDGVLSDALLHAVTYVHAGNVVDVVDTSGGPTVTMGATPSGGDDSIWSYRSIDDVAQALGCSRPAAGERLAVDADETAWTTVIVELEIDGDPADARSVVGDVLDDGVFQDTINDYSDDRPVEVVSAVVR